MPEPPQILRIKRKRGQDPLQALILGAASKRVKLSLDQKSYYFQLNRTDQAHSDADVSGSVLFESAASGSGRHFVIPKRPNDADTVIPHELADMVDTFLHVEDQPTRRKRRGRLKTESPEEDPGASGPPAETKGAAPDPTSNVSELSEFLNDYVFDVYTLSEPLTSQNFPQSEIGYIKFFDDKDYNLMNSDDSAESAHSDDEDSNAESFYQNDYPEDEDAGAFSETYDDESDNDEDEDNIGPVILESAEAFEGNAYLRGQEQAEGQFDDLYDEFFGDSEQPMDFLAETNDDYERQNFFKDEEDDELAQHRDRIFGRLQKMIDEK